MIIIMFLINDFSLAYKQDPLTLDRALCLVSRYSWSMEIVGTSQGVREKDRVFEALNFFQKA